MKKLSRFQKSIAVLLVIALMLMGMDSSLLSRQVRAEDNPTIYADGISVKAGDEVKIPFLIKDLKALCGFDIKLTYDSSVLSMKDVSKGALISGNKSDPVFDVSESGDGYFELMWAGVDDLQKDGELFIVTFDVLSKAEAGKSNITMESGNPENIFDSNFNNVSLNYSAVEVSVEGDEEAPSEKPTSDSTKAPEKPSTGGSGFYAYLGYTSLGEKESFFRDSSKAVWVSKDGEYTIEYTFTDSSEDIFVLVLDTSVNIDQTGSMQITLGEDALTVGGKAYDISEYSIGTDEYSNYRITLRNPYADDYDGLGGVKIPSVKGEKLVFKFIVTDADTVEESKATQGPSAEKPEKTSVPKDDAQKTEAPAPSQAAAPGGSAGDGTAAAAQGQTGAATSAAVSSETPKPTAADKIVIKKPGKVTIKKLKKAGKGGAKVTWKKVKCDGYQVQYARKRSFAGKKTAYAYSASRYIYGKSKKKYFVRVRAYNEGYVTSSGRWGTKYGKWSKVKSIKLK